MSQRLSLSTWEPIGEPVRVADHVVVNYDCGFCTIAAASAAGPLIYQGTGAEHQLVWLDRSGESPQTVGAPDDALRVGFRMSPDRRTVAFAREAGEYQDIWLLGIGSGVMQRFTSDRANKVTPIWSPDGGRVTFAWDPAGILDLYEKSIDAEGNGTLLFASPEHKSARLDTRRAVPAVRKREPDDGPRSVGFSRTTPAAMRSTFSRFPDRVAESRLRTEAVRSRSGATTATMFSTKMRDDRWRRFPSCSTARP